MVQEWPSLPDGKPIPSDIPEGQSRSTAEPERDQVDQKIPIFGMEIVRFSIFTILRLLFNPYMAVVWEAAAQLNEHGTLLIDNANVRLQKLGEVKKTIKL